ncbi:MAG TPA: hypothetical protein VME41_14095 [Stellaceae bacterium]|nr:hypothetical protein [Stellaceae bacterium]
MSLTLEAEQRLTRAGLTQFFDRNRASWLANARETYEFLTRNFPDDATIRQDDVAKALRPIIEVDQTLRTELNRRKLSQRYWIGDFTDLIIERTWNEIRGANE